MSIPKKYLIEKIILTEAYVDVNEILKILTQSSPANSTHPKYSYYKKLANWANEKHRQQNLKNINLEDIELSDSHFFPNNRLYITGKIIKQYNTLGHLLEALKNLMKQEGKYNPDSELSNLIQKTTVEVLAGLSGIKDTTPEEPKEPEEPKNPKDPDESEDPKEPEEPKEPNSPSGKHIDWTAERAKRLAHANGTPTSKILDQFYNDYYSQEYAGVATPEEDLEDIVSKLKSLDKILIQEFTKLGYNPEVNPLAQFLKILIKLKKENKSKIFDKLTPNTYGAIHNSFIKKTITGNMLGKWSQNSIANILFCEDLYNHTGLEIVEYLANQHSILDAAKGDKRFSDDPKLLVAKLLVQQKNFGKTYEEKVKNLLDLPNVLWPTQPDAKLRSISEISELYTYIFPGHNVRSAKTEEEQETADKLNTITGLAKHKKVVLSMIQLIIHQDSFEKTYPKETDWYKKWLAEIAYTPNDRNIAISNEILSDGYNLTTADKLALVNKLRAIYNKLSKKAKD